MRTGINIWKLNELMNSANSCAAQIKNKWIPARPYGRSDWKIKLRAIKLILTEKADMVVWPSDQ